jgi:hypothetical protein
LKAFLSAFSTVAAIGLLLASPPVSVAARRDRDSVVAAVLKEDPVSAEFVAMLGSAVPERTAVGLAGRLRVLSEAGADAPLHSRLVSTGSPATPRFEASGLSLTIRTLAHGDVRVDGARVVLSPSPDGASCRFELTGTPLGGASTLEASGTVEWGKGPLGGHRLEGTLRIGDAAVEALRALLPGRLDPSVGGPISLVVQADGIVGETTTEDAPATPLRGQLEWKAGWTVLGRSAPLTVTSAFSLDDRMVRLVGGHLKWMDFDLPVQGWFEPQPWGRFDLTAAFADIDTRKVAGDWSVPETWRPASTLSGRFTWKGKVGESMLRYEATAPQIDLPGFGGWPLRLTDAKLQGGILEVNADVAASIGGRTLRLGELELPRVLGGLQWWRQSFNVVTQKTPLWNGTHTASLGWKPAEHPAFSISGTLTGAEAPSMIAVLLPDLGLDVDGRASMSYSFGQDAARAPKWTVHGSLMAGRLGNVDFVARLLDALAAADPALALPDAASLVTPPRSGKGTRVDRLFLEVEKRGDGFDLGGVLLDSGEFAFEGDGRWSPAAGLALDGTVALPAAVIGKLVEAAPWIAALRSAGGTMVVPVTVRGATSAPVVALGADYADRIGRARRGEAVSAPAPRETRHVGVDGIPSIPGDPAQIGNE